MIRFVHTADIHFGMENYGKIDPETGIHTRLLDFERALNECIDYAINTNVDLFVFAGDAYKTSTPSPTQQRLLMKCFFRLYHAGIPVVIVVGNHDHPMSFGKAHALDIFNDLPLDGFTVISKPQTKILTTKNGPIQIVGIPWPSRSTLTLQGSYVAKNNAELTDTMSSAVAHIVAESAQLLDHGAAAILVGHLTVSNGIFSGSEKRAIYGNDPIVLPSQLAIKPFDYVALGHLHRYQNLNPHGHPAIIYSGSIERIDFGERKDTKGFCVVTIYDKQKTEHTFIPVTTRPFIQIEVTLKNDMDHTEQILQAISQFTITDAIVKIVYHIAAHVQDKVNTGAIQKECATAHYLIGIIPVREAETRERRAFLKHEENIENLLDHYFAQNAESASRKKILLEKALALLEQHDT